MGEKALREVMRLTPSHVKMRRAFSQTDVQGSASFYSIYRDKRHLKENLCLSC